MFVLTLFVLIGYGIDVARGECGGGNVFCLTIKSQTSCADGGCEWDSELNLVMKWLFMNYIFLYLIVWKLL